jgi:hypothetical protein
VKINHTVSIRGSNIRVLIYYDLFNNSFVWRQDLPALRPVRKDY